jgi:hypothetical protein
METKLRAKDIKFQAMINVVRATRQICLGQIAQAESLLAKAEGFTCQYTSSLEALNQPQAADEFLGKMLPFLEEAKGVIEAVRSKPLEFFRGEALEKRIPDTASREKQPINRSPGRAKGYDYKPFHELSPEDQAAAHTKYQGVEMHQHLYPMEPSTGKLAHNTRQRISGKVAAATPPQANARPGVLSGVARAPGETPPQASGHLPKPEHTPGRTVWVNKPDHEHHGSFGMVMHPNPVMGEKVAVRVRNRAKPVFETIHVDPHEVSTSRPSAPKSKSLIRSESALVNKSRVALKTLRKGRSE